MYKWGRGRWELVSWKRRGRSQPVPVEKEEADFSHRSQKFRIYSERLSFALTLLLLAPALCNPCQLIMLLPQLAEALPLLLQTSLQLQDQNLSVDTGRKTKCYYI